MAPKNTLDKDLRGYLETNKDILTVIDKPVSIDDIGALSAQSEGPILFENIKEHPGFRLCDMLLSPDGARRITDVAPVLRQINDRLRDLAARLVEGSEDALDLMPSSLDAIASA
ncbi:MAG: hypothetical protein VW169_09945 [Rhodospirillaceae bacterium]|jgi:hypothetical protein